MNHSVNFLRETEKKEKIKTGTRTFNLISGNKFALLVIKEKVRMYRN